MAQFESQKQKIAKAGAQLVYLAAERRGGVWRPEKFLANNPISFPFLLDEDSAVTKQYGLYHAIGIDAFDIAHPATLVVDRVGIVRWIYRGDSQFDRAPLDDVFKAVRGIES